VALSGTRKAAMLLMSLDAGTAAELLKSARPETITAIAAELAYLKATGFKRGPAGAESAKEFFGLLSKRKSKAGAGDFLKDMLDKTLGKDRSPEMLRQVQGLVESRDPFLSIRAVDVREIANALSGESAQVAAVVLAELPEKASATMLPLLAEDVRGDAVRIMASGEKVSPEARLRVAAMIRTRLEAARKQEGPVQQQVSAVVGGRDQRLRKVAVLLRGLSTDFRNNMVKAIQGHSADLAKQVQKLMVDWEDVPVVADRALQEVLRGVESRKLALALVGADSAIGKKVRANISERAAALLDEETSLLSKPKPEDIQAAREGILDPLRELNEAGMLEFQEG